MDGTQARIALRDRANGKFMIRIFIFGPFLQSGQQGNSFNDNNTNKFVLKISCLD